MYILQRLMDVKDKGMYGVLIGPDGPLCTTLENNWLNNKPWVSCIPSGIYDVVPYSSQKYPNVWEITDVIDRTHILFHAGNFITDTHGCVLVGKTYEDFGIGASKKALNELRDTLPKKFSLLIINPLTGDIEK